MINNKKGQAVIYGLAQTGFLIVLGLFLMSIFPTFKDVVFAATTSLWIRIPVSATPIFYFIGVVYSFIRAIRSGATN